MRQRLAALLAITVIVPIFILRASPDPEFSPYVDSDGNISRPQGFRESWPHLGTYFVTGETADGNSMHSVYTEKRHLDAFNETGEWPDGAVLVKEVFHATGSQLTTGAANWADRPNVWFVVIKDRRNRFPGNPLWGNGWGWALFKSDAPLVQVARDYKKDCLGCHLPAKGTDYIYTQGYPAIHNRPDAESMAAPPVAAPAMAVPSPDAESAKGSAERGAAIFRETCIFCHTVNGDRRKLGPSLAVIARDGRLPSGKNGSPENILRQINKGGGGMPAFADSLSAQEKADVIAYVRQPR